MSLSILAARIAAVEALRGQTWAGDLVFDTSGEIPDTDSNDPRFAINVESGGQNGSTASLILTLSLLQRLDVGEGQIGWAIPFASQASERVLDCFATAVIRRLTSKTLAGWTAAFLGLTKGLTVRTAQASGAATRTLILDFQIGAAPTEFAGADGDWKQFLASLDAAKHPCAALFDFMIPPPVPPALDWAAFGIDCGIRLEPAAPPVAAAAPAKPKRKRARK